MKQIASLLLVSLFIASPASSDWWKDMLGSWGEKKDDVKDLGKTRSDIVNQMNRSVTYYYQDRLKYPEFNELGDNIPPFNIPHSPKPLWSKIYAYTPYTGAL